MRDRRCTAGAPAVRSRACVPGLVEGRASQGSHFPGDLVVDRCRIPLALAMMPPHAGEAVRPARISLSTWLL
jgi:hypothetical protein